jgi:hypothetical protein
VLNTLTSLPLFVHQHREDVVSFSFEKKLFVEKLSEIVFEKKIIKMKSDEQRAIKKLEM